MCRLCSLFSSKLAKRINRAALKTYHSSSPIQVNLLDVIVVGIAPVHSAGSVVQRQTVRPQHVGGDENAAVGSIHPGFLYPPYAVIDLILLPVGPVHPAVTQRDKHVHHKHSNADYCMLT